MTSSTRIWAIGSVTVMIILLVAGWFLAVQPALAVAGAATIERSGIDSQNATKQAELAQLSAQNKNLTAVRDEYAALKKSIPASSDSATFISGLDSLAASTGVKVEALTIGDAEAYTVPQSAVAVPAPTAAATPAPSSSPSPSAAPAPAAAAPAVVTAKTSPLITGENLVGIKVGVDLTGPYQSVLNYLNGLQSGSRLVLVTGFTSSASADSPGSTTAHIDGLIYVLKQAK